MNDVNKSEDIINERLAFWDVLANNIRKAIESGAKIPDLRVIIQPGKEE